MERGRAIGPSGHATIAELCRKEGIAHSLYYSWSKELLEAGKRRLAGDTVRRANTGEVKDLRAETMALKEPVADLSLKNRLLKRNERALSVMQRIACRVTAGGGQE